MRPMIKYLKEHVPGPLYGAEIGVFKGVNSEDILKNLPLERFYAIDPWEEYHDGNLFKKTVNTSTIKQAELEAQQRLAPYPTAVILKKTSKKASKDIPFLDFLYIDGAHDFRSVRTDIRLFFFKTKYIGGHDYNRKNVGVILAVNLHYLLNFRKLKLHKSENDWWFVKR